jgi:hypothetical protein
MTAASTEIGTAPPANSPMAAGDISEGPTTSACTAQGHSTASQRS